MGKKIFVSYKYSDNNVYPLGTGALGLLEQQTTARHYVDEIQGLLASDDHINKGEADGEDLSDFKDSTIQSKLRDKIYDSSITIVVISPNMKESYKAERDQWIPWEITYSLKEHTRNGRTSRSNAMLAVVLPDQYGQYTYCMEVKTCCASGCSVYNTDSFFKIISDNMFNMKMPDFMDCSGDLTIYKGNHSYIHFVKWADFKLNVNWYLNIANGINDNANDYSLTKSIS